MNKIYDTAVFIGRFQPFHRGHYRVVQKALENAKELVIVLGSSHSPRTLRNPLNDLERQNIIRSSLSGIENGRVKIVKVHDNEYNESAWVSSIVDEVNKVVDSNNSITLIGMNKDESSYYLSKFPMWDSIDFVPNTTEIVSSTDIRNLFLEQLNSKFDEASFDDYFLNRDHAKTAISWLSSAYSGMHDDLELVENYESTWGEGPHFTVDSIVETSGHILLVRRNGDYARGLYALPGGFLNKGELILDATIRELREETLLKIPEKVLRGSVVSSKMYDNPFRDERSRVLTNATHFKLEDRQKLPKVKGSDDADKAFWAPFNFMKDPKVKEMFFSDHLSIISDKLKMTL